VTIGNDVSISIVESSHCPERAVATHYNDNNNKQGRIYTCELYSVFYKLYVK